MTLGEGTANKKIAQHMWLFVAPDPLAAVLEIIVLIVLVGGGIFIIRKRTRHKQAMSRATSHTVKAQENLHTIAEQYQMPWKQLARINKLKPPYQLKLGQILTVTPPHPRKHKKQ